MYRNWPNAVFVCLKHCINTHTNVNLWIEQTAYKDQLRIWICQASVFICDTQTYILRHCNSIATLMWSEVTTHIQSLHGECMSVLFVCVFIVVVVTMCTWKCFEKFVLHSIHVRLRCSVLKKAEELLNYFRCFGVSLP